MVIYIQIFINNYIMYMQAVITVLLIIIIWELMKRVTYTFKSHYTNPFSEYVYMDANATTPVLPAALDAYCKTVYLGNASSQYAKNLGDIPKIFDKAKCLISEWLGIDDSYKIVWNSGASEGNNFVLRACADSSDGSVPHIIASSIEHKTSLDCLEQLRLAGRIQYSLISPNYQGVIDPVEVANHIKPNTRLITVMHVNNELGTVNPINQIGAIAKHNNILFHVDAVQSFGKDRIPVKAWHIDALTASMHKVYGPQGVGLMILSPRFHQTAQICGSQFDGIRGGTENIPGIAAATVALQNTWQDRSTKNDRLRKFKLAIVAALDREFGLLPYSEFCGKPDSFRFGETNGIKAIVLGETDPRFNYPCSTTSPSSILISFIKTGTYSDEYRICNINLKQALFNRKIIISIGSACNTGVTSPSHVLTAIKAPFIVRSGTVRISMSDLTTEDEVQKLIKNLIECIKLQNG
jgi:cysteine desulfurase